MIRLTHSGSGKVVSFDDKTAKSALEFAKGQKERGQSHWFLDDKGDHKLDKDGLVIKKAKKE